MWIRLLRIQQGLKTTAIKTLTTRWGQSVMNYSSKFYVIKENTLCVSIVRISPYDPASKAKLSHQFIVKQVTLKASQKNGFRRLSLYERLIQAFSKTVNSSLFYFNPLGSPWDLNNTFYVNVRLVLSLWSLWNLTIYVNVVRLLLELISTWVLCERELLLLELISTWVLCELKLLSHD